MSRPNPCPTCGAKCEHWDSPKGEGWSPWRSLKDDPPTELPTHGILIRGSDISEDWSADIWVGDGGVKHLTTSDPHLISWWLSIGYTEWMEFPA